MKIFLVRNAEAVANVERRFCRSSPLTPNGVEQAVSVGTRLGSVDIRRIYSSPLEHAQQTAEILAQKISRPLEIIEGLRNIDTGAWEGLGRHEIVSRWPEQWHRFFGGKVAENEEIVPSGETLNQFAKRVVDALAQLVNSGSDEDTICVVAHNLSNAAILAKVVGAPPAAIFRFEQYNACINLIDHASKSNSRLLFVNDVSHIEAAGIPVHPGAFSGSPQH